MEADMGAGLGKSSADDSSTVFSSFCEDRSFTDNSKTSMSSVTLSKSPIVTRLLSVPSYQNSDYDLSRPEVSLPSLSGPTACHYAGVLTASEAGRFIEKPRSFLLYHLWRPMNDPTETLDLFVVYKSSQGNLQHCPVLRQDSGYTIGNRSFSELQSLVIFLDEKVACESRRDPFEDLNISK